MLSRAVVALSIVALSGCAPGMELARVQPQDIPDLERRVAAQPDDADGLTRLGVAYGMADRPADALRSLEAAVALPGASPAAWAHLGAVREEAGDVEGAAEAYREYLDLGAGAARATVEGRLAVLRRELLRREARAALAMEAELSLQPGDRNTIGVLPLLVDGPPEYEALGVGLADLLTTDLGITGRIHVLERAQLAALLDEMRLAFAGFTDHAPAARAARLLRAGRLVQGQIAIGARDLDAHLTALVVDAAAAAAEGEASAAGQLERLMELETQLALSIYEELGIQLTAAERARIEDKPTQNLHAFLAYSQGLQLMDAGDFSSAAARFDAAATLDPGFLQAAAAARQATVADEADVRTVADEATADLTRQVEAGLAGVGMDLERLVDSTVPAGASTTATGGGDGDTGSTQTTSVETTEVTAGSGTTGQRIRVPIIIVRPQPILLPVRP
jgi:tetratricopeptide (TPR) repeat protein